MTTLIVEENQSLPRISWGAIFAGAVLALAIYLVLSVLGSAVGASMFEPTREANPLSGFPFAAGAWMVVASVLALIAGGYYAGRSAQALGWLHGLLTWSLVTLVSTYLLAAAAGSLISTTASVFGKGIEVAGQGIAKAAPAVVDKVKNEMQQNGVTIDFDNLQSELNTLLTQSGKPELQPAKVQQQAQRAGDDAKATAQQSAQNPQQSDQALAQWFQRTKRSAQPMLNAADKEALVNIIAARTGKSPEEARQIADDYERTYNQVMVNYQNAKQQAEQKARAAADVAAKNLARASWWTFALMLVGAVVAGAAGNLGFKHQPLVETQNDASEELATARGSRLR